MRSLAQSARLVLLLCLASTSFVAAQQKRQPPDGTSSASRGTRSTFAAGPTQNVDGLAILTAALDSRHRIVTRRDCSHFVHDLYEQAGFHYEYAGSVDLYVGVDEFRQVTYPQPGDLIVWRGHVGIVVNPSQRSFFSLLRTGPGIDLYDAPYWKQRGHPRFFRYVKSAPTGSSSPIQNASWKPFARPNDARANDVRSADDETATDDPATDESARSLTEAATPTESTQARPADTLVHRAIVVSAVKLQPAQVRDAFLQACKGEESGLRGLDLFKTSQAVIVFEEIQVKKLHISRDEGWAEVQIEEPVSLSEQKTQVRKRTEHQRWALTRRDRTSWELMPAPNTIYVTQAAATQLLASELARLTADRDSADKAQEKARLARVLDALLEK